MQTVHSGHYAASQSDCRLRLAQSKEALCIHIAAAMAKAGIKTTQTGISGLTTLICKHCGQQLASSTEADCNEAIKAQPYCRPNMHASQQRIGFLIDIQRTDIR